MPLLDAKVFLMSVDDRAKDYRRGVFDGTMTAADGLVEMARICWKDKAIDKLQRTVACASLARAASMLRQHARDVS